jgi:hypothetical protein
VPTDQGGADPGRRLSSATRALWGLEGALRAVEGASGRPGGRWKVKVPRKQPAANSGKVNSGNR